MTDSDILNASKCIQQRAWNIIKQTEIIEKWANIGAETHIVGSLAMGLMMKHRDIDMHVYSSTLSIKNGFNVMAHIAETDNIKKIEYHNLTNTDEACIEWHAWYDDEYGQTWQIDIINILKGSRYDGYFERMASRIKETLSEHSRKIDFFVLTSLPPVEGIFFDGQIFDAYKFATDLIKSAKKSLLLIDNYVDESVLLMLSKRNPGVSATIYTQKITKQLQLDLDKHNDQYPPVNIRTYRNSHDRFLIIDDKEVYHIGASLKDLGKKMFAFSKLEIEPGVITEKL